MHENELSEKIIGAAIKVHKNLGPGLLESAYEECLYYELEKLQLKIEKQKPMPLIYENVKLDIGYRIDILVEDKVVIEIKSVEALNDVHLAQILTYLKLSNSKLGLLINFNVSLLKNGIRRVVNKL
jgi:GxxExxY protein